MREWMLETGIRITAHLVLVSGVALTISLLVLLPAAICRKARVAAGYCLILISRPISLTTFIFGAALAFISFGWIGLIIGLLLGGFGVVPVGIIGAFFRFDSFVLGLALCSLPAVTIANALAAKYMLGDRDTFADEPHDIRNIALAVFGIATFILQILTSAEDLEGNCLTPLALIGVSGAAFLIFVIMATGRLWKSARNVSIILASSTIILFVLATIQEFGWASYGSVMVIMANVVELINLVTLICAIMKLFKIKQPSQLPPAVTHNAAAADPDWDCVAEQDKVESVCRS